MPPFVAVVAMIEWDGMKQRVKAARARAHSSRRLNYGAFAMHVMTPIEILLVYDWHRSPGTARQDWTALTNTF